LGHSHKRSLLEAFAGAQEPLDDELLAQLRVAAKVTGGRGGRGELITVHSSMIWGI